MAHSPSTLRKIEPHAHDTENDQTIAAPPAAAPASKPTRTATITIAGVPVTLPYKRKAGDYMSADDAVTLDTFTMRQFSNNQNAMAAARAKRFAAATTDDVRAANAPLSADQLAALYANYAVHVGEAGPRADTSVKLREDAAWSVWAETVMAHNKSVVAGGSPVLAKAGSNVVPLLSMPRKAKGADEAAHKLAVADYEAARKTVIDALLAAPAYADRIQSRVDAMSAPKATVTPADTVNAVRASVSFI